MLGGCGGEAATSAAATGEAPGLRVVRVEPWGAAAAAGIEAGDVVESWRMTGASPDTAGVATDPLELLWSEHDAARSPVTLVVRRGLRREEKMFADAGWAMVVRPALPSAALAAWERAVAGGGAGAWAELERRAVADSRIAGAWAAWRRGIAATSSVEQAEEAAGAFQRARDRAGSPRIVALLHAEEAQAFWLATQYTRAGAPWQAAATALRELDSGSPPLEPESEIAIGGFGGSPLLGRVLTARARYLEWQRRAEDARELLAEAEEILQVHPQARTLHVEVMARRASEAWTSGDLEQARSIYLTALALLRPGDPLHAGFSQMLGRLLKDQGEYEAAIEQYREALAVDRGTPRGRGAVAGANNSLGLLNKKLGNFERAERYYRRALELFPPGGAAEAGMRNNLGNLALRRGDLELAATYHRQALELRRVIQPESASVASSTSNLGAVLRLRGEHEEAAKVLEEALALKTALAPDSLLVASTLLESGLNQLALGDRDAAARMVSRACEIQRALVPSSLDLGSCLLALGDVSEHAGDRQRAVELWQQGLAMVEKLRRRVPSELGKARFSAQFDAHYRNLVFAYLEAGEPERAFVTLEAARARMLRALLQQHGEQAARLTSPELLEARRRVETGLERSLGQLGSLHPVDDAARIREIQQRRQRLESEREELNERLYRSVRGLERIEQVPSISLDRIRSHLPAGSVGLLYMLGDQRSYVFVISGETSRLAAVELAVGRVELARRVDVFRGLLERGRDSATLEAALVEQGSDLFELLLAPVTLHLEAASQLYISPDTELARLPFAALIRSREPLRFVAEWKPHAVVPSLSSLVELREEQADRPEPELEWLGVGAPDLARSAPARARGLGALPGSRRELETLAGLFGGMTMTLTGGAATEAAARAALPRGRYLHFATHALLNRRFPMSSSLVLSSGDLETERDDGLLHGWEILGTSALAAELVTLAGCETGRGAEWAGEGLIGLAQAFHYAGTPAILASQWRVGDAWVGTLTEAFYRELLAGSRPMDALAAAQRRLIASASGPEAAMAHPFYGAAFTFFGVSD